MQQSIEDKTVDNIQSIEVIGRRWFQRSAGNTYNAVLIRVNGETVAKLGMAYGYGEFYMQRAANELERLGYMPGRVHYPHGGGEPAWHYFRDRKIPFNYYAHDVQRKRDLEF